MNFNQFKTEFQKSNVYHYKSRIPNKVLLSVIVQTFNHEKYLRRCLDSILFQRTDFEFEILIGEDDSTDNTRDICIEYANRYPDKIRLFLHDSENKIPVLDNPTGNFNAFYNLFSATGDYIAFCEGDDAWTDKFKLQKQVDFLAIHTEYSFSYHSFKTIDENSLSALSAEENNQPTFNINSYDLKTNKYHPLLLTICFSNVFQQIPEEMINVINVDTFIISLLGNHGDGKFLDSIEPSLYRKHLGGIWSHRNKEKKYLSKVVTYQKLMDYYNRIDEGFIADFYRSKLRSTYKSMILLELKNVKPINVIKYLSRLRSL
ncbi:glycosyltransferase involved in cell wall biosynthesis [Gillisia mitskevichiae]|uniref:Glycosyltransferase involved in cell wall biosynthesis n=1 Tax=Gillisia mitskevichiae TaxID=270921 RepID=A0A495PK81_9FLAO|nr:glycosyltransferase [Gillisia mitskevichiae]RKS50577.1 glycosyltransferase involved in cell wall biosynthesis [Gillisia mitskevichiae]